MSSRNSRGFRRNAAAEGILATCIAIGSWSDKARAEDTAESAAGTTESGSAESTTESASPDVQKQQDLKTEKVDDDAHKASTATPQPDDAPTADEPKPGDDPHDHFFQFGLRVGFVPGYKIVFRYQSPGSETHLCNFPDGSGEQQKICGFVAPPALEVAASFALLGALEPYVFGRFGLAASGESGTSNQLTGGVGARVYTTTESRLKPYFEPAVALSFEGWNGDARFLSAGRTAASLYPVDFLIHLGFGAQYDFVRYVGAFVNIGFDVGFVRGISTTAGGTIGVQGRFP